MANFVIAGKSDCPKYAQVELLSDELHQRLPEFSVHKITLRPDEWDDWLVTTCKERGWKYTGGSPIIWRELITRGGKGILVGSSNEFLEMAKGYYGLTSSKITDDLELISVENKKAKVSFDIQEEKRIYCVNPYRITVTDAHTDLAYSILPHLCGEKIAKTFKNMYLTLFSSCSGDELEKLRGISMELCDCVNSAVRMVSIETDVNKAFLNADLVIILNSKKVDNSCLEMLKTYGRTLKSQIKYNAKILVSGVQPMIACYVISQVADGIPRENFFALSRFQENRIKSAIAKKLSVITAAISNVIIWGTSLEYICDHSISTASHYEGSVWAPHIDGFSHSVNEVVYDKQWLENELPKLLLEDDRIDSSKEKSNLSLSSAIISQIKDLLRGDCITLSSLGMISKGWYGIPEGLVCSFPVYYSSGMVKVKEDIKLDESIKKKIELIGCQLKEYCDGLNGD